MDVQTSPPSVEVITAGLRPVLTAGLPVRPDYDQAAILAMRGVVARSIDPSDRLNRVKALDGLLKTQLTYLPDDELGEPARVLFGLTPGTRGKNLTASRQRAKRDTKPTTSASTSNRRSCACWPGSCIRTPRTTSRDPALSHHPWSHPVTPP